ncbi:MAG TPA: hypothetical protein PLB10_13735 [Thiolinea sp.]|nr:hypothetical protein [Thiolinea sp.]
MILSLLLIAGSAAAQPQQNLRNTEVNNIAQHYQNPLVQLGSMFTLSAVYDYLSTNPDFVKLSNIAERLWATQTGQHQLNRVQPRPDDITRTAPIHRPLP